MTEQTDETTTTVQGLARRPSLTLESYTDLTGVDALSIDGLGDGLVAITFPGALTPEVQAAVLARLESVDDRDQADRAAMRALIARAAALPQGATSLVDADAVLDLVLRLAAIRLGDDTAVRPAAGTESEDRAKARAFLATRDPNRIQIAAQLKLLTLLVFGLEDLPPATDESAQTPSTPS